MGLSWACPFRKGLVGRWPEKGLGEGSPRRGSGCPGLSRSQGRGRWVPPAFHGNFSWKGSKILQRTKNIQKILSFLPHERNFLKSS